MNETLIGPIAGAFGSTVGSIIGYIQVAVGGLFGLYLILFFIRLKEVRDMKKFMKHVSEQLEDMQSEIKSFKTSLNPSKKKKA
jgi:hypothetical protein